VYLLNNREVDKNNNFIPDSLDNRCVEMKADLKKLKESMDIVAQDLYNVIDSE